MLEFRIVSGQNAARADLPGELDEHAEFHKQIADAAGIRRSAGHVFTSGGLEHTRAEPVESLEEAVFDPERPDDLRDRRLILL